LGSWRALSIVSISRGTSVSTVVAQLEELQVITHPIIFRILLRLTGTETKIQPGAYLFDEPESPLRVIGRLRTGDYGIPPAKVTIVEGASVREMATVVNEAVPQVTEADFIALARQHEGYLFPDTYIFPPGADAELVISTMRKNFDVKVEPLTDEITASGHSLTDVITMASLVEKEGRTTAVRQMIAGILWSRLEREMPLQVDAVFGYIFDRDTYSPSFDDLKVDSPYNTYTHIGLPPTPINNPGLDSIKATLTPTKSNYLYYLVDTQGGIHYATTFAEHQLNQEKYLRY
jgi:UPF0755 protein